MICDPYGVVNIFVLMHCTSDVKDPVAQFESAPVSRVKLGPMMQYVLLSEFKTQPHK